MPQRKQDIRRRTGCVQCKSKHIRCTEEHPRCGRCERLDLECVRGLKLIFREDAIQRGISFGREGVWTKRPDSNARSLNTEINFQGIPLGQYINRWVFLNSVVGDFQRGNDLLRSRSSPQPRHHGIDLSTNPSVSTSIYHPLHSFPDTESYLLDYFIRGISPSCSLSDSHNPYISLVIPLCFVSITLRQALLAVAANQLCLLGNYHFTHESCHYKNKALQGIRQEISAGVHDDGTVASVLMLCFQDISDGCSPSWMTHLRGGLQLINYNTCHSPSDLWKFFRMYFVAHDIMSHTTSESWLEDEVSHLWSESDNLEEIDTLMGCSRGLMTLINKISVHASAKAKILKDRHLTSAESQYYANTSSDIGTALYLLKQKLPKHSTGREDLERIAKIKHLAALLYLNERLGPLRQAAKCNSSCASVSVNVLTRQDGDGGLWHTVQERGSSGMKNHRAYGRQSGEEALFCHRLLGDEPSIDGEESVGVDGGCKSRLVSSIIELISTLPDIATLLWPLFVLSNVGLENEEQRRFVLDRLANVQKTRNLGSVRRTIDAVKHAFVTRGLLCSGDRTWGHETYRYISLA